MKLLIVLCLVAVAAAAPQSYNDRLAEILKYYYENNGDGSYNYGFGQSDGTQAQQRGVIKNQGTENEALYVEGSYSYVGPDGVNYNVNYKADENGYQPEIEQGPGGGVPPGVVASLLG